jgi:hypothetical protein
MKNLSHHTDRLRELATLLMIRGTQMVEMSKLGWLMGLVEHAMRTDSLYFLYLLLLSFSKILASFDPLHRHVELILIFLENPL